MAIKGCQLFLTNLLLMINGYKLITAWLDWANLTLFVSESEQETIEEIVEPLH